MDEQEAITPTPIASIEDELAFAKSLLDGSGGSFKRILQIANLNNANSNHSTLIATLAK